VPVHANFTTYCRCRVSVKHRTAWLGPASMYRIAFFAHRQEVMGAHKFMNYFMWSQYLTSREPMAVFALRIVKVDWVWSGRVRPAIMSPPVRLTPLHGRTGAITERDCTPDMAACLAGYLLSMEYGEWRHDVESELVRHSVRLFNR
jgi:hypothetical protein